MKACWWALGLSVAGLAAPAASSAALSHVWGGASPGPEWNYDEQSSTTFVSHYNAPGVWGWEATASGGWTPFVFAHAWSAEAGPQAFGGAVEEFRYIVVPGDSAWANSSTSVQLSYAAHLSKSSTHRYDSGEQTVTIWSDMPSANGDGWHLADAGGARVDYSLQGVGLLTQQGDPIFTVQYNQWHTVKVQSSVSQWAYDQAIDVWARCDMSLALGSDGIRPGDTLVLETTSAIPEPATAMLLLVIPSLMGLARRRQKSQGR